MSNKLHARHRVYGKPGANTAYTACGRVGTIAPTSEEINCLACRNRRGLAAPDTSEALDLRASEIACAVADAWVPIVQSGLGMDRTLAAALDRLEAVTRPSALRKVRPR